MKKQVEELQSKIANTEVIDENIENNKSAVLRIKEKEEETRLVAEKRASLTKERESKLFIAREQKNMQMIANVPKTSMDKKPQIDRSVKPATRIEDIPVRERDFSPDVCAVVSHFAFVLIKKKP